MKKILSIIVPVTLLIVAGVWYYSNTRVKSLDQLKERYVKAHTNGNANAAMNLVYMDGVTEEIKASIRQDLETKFKRPLDTVEITDPNGDNYYRYTHNGVTYHENLPIIKYLVVKYKPNGNPNFISDTYGIGENNGSYYIVTAVPVTK